MSEQHDQSHRQEREHEKEGHVPSTRGMYLSSAHLTWAVVGAVIFIGVAVMVWTFLLPAL